MHSNKLYPSTVLHGRLAHKLGRDIVSGTIGEGNLLPREADLSTENHMSRQAVREALKVLAAKGLISTRRRAGSVVTTRNHWNIFDQDVLNWYETEAFARSMAGPLAELRRMIEPRAAALAAVGATDADMAAIACALARLEKCNGDLKAIPTADAAFHAAVLAASGNVLLARLAALLSPAMEVIVALQSKVQPPLEAADTGHPAIFRAIASRDPDRATAVMTAHLDAGLAKLEGLIVAAGHEAEPQGVLIAEAHYPTTPLHGQLARDLGQAIVVGNLPPGAYLPREAELAETRGVSRQAVREALRVLAAKGLVSTRQRSGTSVSGRSEWNLLDPDVIQWLGTGGLRGGLLEDLVELREIVEPEAACLAAERRIPGALAALAEALQQTRDAAQLSPEHVQADARFHAGILAASGNRFLARLGSTLMPLLEATLDRDARAAAGMSIVGLPKHEAVYEAIRSGDSEGAKAATQSLISALRHGPAVVQ